MQITLFDLEAPVNFLIVSTTIMLLMTQWVSGIDKPLGYEERKKPLKMSPLSTTPNKLEAILGIDGDVALKISMDLNGLKPCLEQEQQNITAKLALTDSEVFLVDHISVSMDIPVTYDPLFITCHLQDTPSSFESYGEFVSRFKEACFSQEAQVTYDFQINIREKAPCFIGYLTHGLLRNYSFKGGYTIKSPSFRPNRYVPSISYLSQRGNTNATTAILGGVLSFKKRFYSVNSCQQTFPHQKIEETILDRSEKERFYSCQWIAQSKFSAKTAYREFPENQLDNWPNPPCEFYHLIHDRYDDLEHIRHMNCWDGDSGQTVDISDGRVFSISYEFVNKQTPNPQYIESIVRDSFGKRYIVHYRYLEDAHATPPDVVEKLGSSSGEESKKHGKKKVKREIAQPKSCPFQSEKQILHTQKPDPVFTSVPTTPLSSVSTTPCEKLKKHNASPLNKKYQSKTPPADFKEEERKNREVIVLKKQTSPLNH